MLEKDVRKRLVFENYGLDEHGWKLRPFLCYANAKAERPFRLSENSLGFQPPPLLVVRWPFSTWR